MIKNRFLEIRLARVREADRLRKHKEREIIKKKQTVEEVERRRLKKAETDIRAEEIAREKKADLEKRLKKEILEQ